MSSLVLSAKRTLTSVDVRILKVHSLFLLLLRINLELAVKYLYFSDDLDFRLLLLKYLNKLYTKRK
jgi:hypothetical protein